MDLAELHRRTVGAWTARVESIPSEQWTWPTPCTEWDVRALVNHVVGEERWTGPLLQGRTIEDVGSRFEGDLLGTHPGETALAAAGEAADLVDELLPGGGTVHLSYGEEEMAEYVRQLAADHLVHAWDLAAAVSGDRRLDAEVAQEVATWFAGREALYRDAGLVGPRVSDADGEDPQSWLLSAAGRSESWTTPQH